MTSISKERMETALKQQETISAEDHEKVKGLAKLVISPRSFIFKDPDYYGIEGWEDLTILLGRRNAASGVVHACQGRRE